MNKREVYILSLARKYEKIFPQQWDTSVRIEFIDNFHYFIDKLFRDIEKNEKDCII